MTTVTCVDRQATVDAAECAPHVPPVTRTPRSALLHYQAESEVPGVAGAGLAGAPH